MIISLRICAEEIPSVFPYTSIHSDYTDDILEHVFLLTDPKQCETATLYVAEAEALNAAYKGGELQKSLAYREGRLSCVSIGKPAQEICDDTKIDVLYSDESLALPVGFNAIQKEFDKYYAWDELLSSIVISHGSAKELVEASLEVIRNDVHVVDQYDKVMLYRVYKNVRYTQEQMDEIKENEYLPKRMIADGEQEEQQGRDFVTPGPKFFYMQAHETMTVNNTIYVDGNYRLGLAIESNFRDVGESDYVRSLILGRYIQAAYSGSESLLNSEFELGATALIKESLNGKVIDKALLQKALQDLGWDTQLDQFVCLALSYHNPLLGKSRRSIEPELATTGLLRTFCTCRTFVYESSVFALVDLDKSGMSLQELVQRLPEEVMNGNMACGVSDVFTVLDELRGRYKQAVVTLEICKGKAGVERPVLFSEAMIDITIDSINQSIPPSFFAPKELLDILERDMRYGSSLYETLKTYLYNNWSIAETCRKLFLQRNGAIYRLDKAQKLLPSFDLKVAEDRLKLMLSMEIVDELIPIDKNMTPDSAKEDNAIDEVALQEPKKAKSTKAKKTPKK